MLAPYAGGDLMRIFWLFGLALPPVLLGSVVLIAPQWLTSNPWVALGVGFAALLLWLRSLWWIGDWVYELAGGRPADFPRALDLGFFQPKSSNVLQWTAVVIQATVFTLCVVVGYSGLGPRLSPTMSIMTCLAIGVPIAVTLTLVIRGWYELYYGLRDFSVEDLIDMILGIYTRRRP